VKLTLRTVEANRIEVDPFPFDQPALRVQLIRRQLDRGTFADVPSFRAAYFQATPEAVDFMLCGR
jgi:hypothetical protein